MSKRLVVVGGATAVAGLVLGASIVFGPPAVTGGGNGVQGNVDAPGIKAPGEQGQVGANVRGFNYEFFDSNDKGEVRRGRLRARVANFKPLGITELIEPIADIYLNPRQAITITADKADMEGEDKRVRAGEFTGNVVVTLFEAPEGVELIIDPNNADHERFIRQRIYIDEATTFSVEESLINTRGPVHVTSPQVDFYGIGLRLTYNTQRERIEQLVVNEGRYLLYNPDAESSSFNGPRSGDDEQRSDEAPGTDDEQPVEPGPSQYYTAQFVGQVLVRDGLASELGGDKLTIAFSLGTEAISPPPITPDNAAGLPSLLLTPGARLAQADNTTADPTTIGSDAPLPPAVVIPPINRARSLFSHDPERDLAVTWTDELRVTPLAEKPEQLADDEDAHITLAGEDAYAQTTDDGGETSRIEMARLEYLLSEERTTAWPHDDRLIRITSAALGGEITAQRLTVNQKAGNATLFGPGELTAVSRKDKKPLTVTWTNQLYLELFIEDKNNAPTPTLSDSETSGPARSQTEVLGIKTATFSGGVTTTHPDFNLTASDTPAIVVGADPIDGRLTLAFDLAEPDEDGKRESRPASINASGRVYVKARGDDPDEVFDITADRLTVELEPVSGDDPYASVIRAAGNVEIKQPRLDMTCQHVSIELNEPKADTERSEAPGTAQQDLYAQVRMITANGDVEGYLDDDKRPRRIQFVADTLVADVERDRLTLAAKSKRHPAEVINIDLEEEPGQTRESISGRITGQLIAMDNRAEVLDIQRAGSLTTRVDDPDNPDATLEDSFLSVSWTESMRFNNVTGEAEFVGEVRSESRRSADASEMTCDKLAMLFSPDYKHDPARLIEDDGEDAHDRQIRSATASGNVSFLAYTWADDPSKLSNRLQLYGPRVVFTNRPAMQIGEAPVETVVVEGEGRMVLEDYRPPPEERDDTENDGVRAAMTGRGISEFTWKDRMVLDALENNATLLDRIEMTHIPKDEDGRAGQTVLLDCDKLVADMANTGGLSVWLSDDAPDAQVQRIAADGSVVLEQKGLRKVYSDHLTYTAGVDEQTGEPTQLVDLWSDNNQLITIEDIKAGDTSQFLTLRWDLITDTTEVKDLRGGTKPLD